MRQMDLIRDVLDKQLVDREETRMGRVDGVVLELRDGAPPRVARFELGFVVLAARMSTRLERWLDGVRKRWSVRRSGRQLVPWSAVIEINPHHVKLDVKAEETPAFDWERWLRNHVVDKIPGAK